MIRILPLPVQLKYWNPFGILLMMLILFAACSGSKKLMKDAVVLEKGGLHQEAFDKYTFIYNSYADAEARVGMKRMAQQILNEKVQKAQMQCMSENFDAALIAFDDAIAFRNAYPTFDLNASGNLDESQKECKSRYIDMLYNKAESLVKEDDFESAHIYIRKIAALDRNNQKAQYLETMCDILPNYSAGSIAMDKGLWRDAYVYFNEVCKIDAGFKDALQRRDEALARGTFAIVYKISGNKNISDSREEALAAKIKGVLLASDNPFMELLERDDLDVIYEEQQETMTPGFEFETGAESGKLKRARFILSGELVSLDYGSTAESRSKCDCYAAYKIYSDKVNCYQYSQNASCSATFKYKLLDAETGKLYKSDIISFSDEDVGKRFTYEIMKKISLTSPTGMRDHDVNLSNLQNPETDPLISEQEMLNKMYSYIAMKVADAMNSFRP